MLSKRSFFIVSRYFCDQLSIRISARNGEGNEMGSEIFPASVRRQHPFARVMPEKPHYTKRERRIGFTIFEPGSGSNNLPRLTIYRPSSLRILSFIFLTTLLGPNLLPVSHVIFCLREVAQAFWLHQNICRVSS